MDRTKEEILKAKQLEKYCGGCKKNGGDEEVAKYFNQLVRKKFIEQYGDPDLLPSPHLVKRK